MISSSKRLSARLLCGAGAAAMLAFAGQARAEVRQFDIPSSSLGEALARFGAQSDLAVVTTTEITRAKNSQAVSGAVEPEVALTQLLEGTDLTYRREGDTFLIVRASAPQSGSAAGDGAEGTVEALIVTAQKREEDIQDVPIAISAFSQEALERSQIAGGPDLITQVPNMTFTKTNFTGYSIQIRGIGTQAISATTDPGVAVAFNNTPFIRNRFFEQEFYDLQRVEVLRGPQGTLYGRNATAGVVNIISAKPKFVFEAKASADVSNYSSTRVEGMLNIPLVEDAVALRLAGAWTKRDGYATNEISGQSIDGRDLWSTRASLRVAPSDAPFDVNLIWEHFEENDDRLRSGKQLCKKDVVTDIAGIPVAFDERLVDSQQLARWSTVQPILSQGCERTSLYSPDAFQTPNGASVPFYLPLGGIGLPVAFYDPYASQVQSRDLRVIESVFDPKYQAKADLGQLQVNWDITDGLTLTSETAYSADFVYSLQDFNRFNTAPGAWSTTSGTGLSARQIEALDENGVFCDPQVGCSDRLVLVDLSTSKARQFSQEFRLGSDFDGPFNFSLGANFLRFDTEDKYYVFINALTLAATTSDVNSFIHILNLFPTNPYIPNVSDNAECLKTGLQGPNSPTAGGYYCVYIDPNPIESVNDQGHNYFLSKNPYKLISYAIFGEAYYDITDDLKVTAGLRFGVDKKHAPRIPSQTYSGFSVGYPVLEVVEQEWREPTGRLALDWKPDLAFTDETLLYASYAHGYKAGGANPPPMNHISVERFGGTPASVTRPKTFDPEFVDAFEIGAKNTLADGRVTLNLAAFYYDYKDYQISEIVDRSAFNRNFDAEVWGAEVEMDWRPLENLKLGFKGGYLKTRIADGEEAVDLMDRTAGKEGWSVVRPFPTLASSCILPTFLFVRDTPPGPGSNAAPVGGLGGVSVGSEGGCEIAYLKNHDPVTDLPYVPYPTVAGTMSVLRHFTPGSYPGWDPSTAPNNGEGFTKPLSGNELPNAPNWTATLTADYTLPLPNDWLATLHTDLYWQSESWWRVFNDHEFSELDEYFTMNLAAIFENDEAGWKVMAYVKNVFDRDSITGAFLLSDDTALVTNVFLTEPRLYGVRVTKAWSGGALLGGFGERRDGPFPLTVEVGGQVQRHDAPYEMVRPGVLDAFSEGLDPRATQNRDLDWGDGRAVKLTYRPAGPWSVSAGVRFGRTNNDLSRVHLEESGDSACRYGPANSKYVDRCVIGHSFITATNWMDATAVDREEHTIADFAVGRDFGLGGVSSLKSSATVGLRYAQFRSETAFAMEGVPDWDLPPYAVQELLPKYPTLPANHHHYETQSTASREFQGVGPVLSWDASLALLGDEDIGRLAVDWSISGGVLFGKQKATFTGEEEVGYWTGAFPGFSVAVIPTIISTTPVNIERSRSVTTPVADLSLGLSYEIDRLKIGAGYRWERYFDVLDVGDDAARDADRTIDGPYFKIAVGFGGG